MINIDLKEIICGSNILFIILQNINNMNFTKLK